MITMRVVWGGGKEADVRRILMLVDDDSFCSYQMQAEISAQRAPSSRNCLWDNQYEPC